MDVKFSGRCVVELQVLAVGAQTCLRIMFSVHPYCRLSLFGDPAEYSSIAETLDGMPGVKAHGLLAGLVHEAAFLTSAGLTFLRVRDTQIAE